MREQRIIMILADPYELEPKPDDPQEAMTRCTVEIRYIVNRPYGPIMAIITERRDNPGRSITNATEEICTSVFKTLGRPASGVLFVEHYGPQSWNPIFDNCRPEKDRYAIVAFDKRTAEGELIDPTWHPIDEAEINSSRLDGIRQELRQFITYEKSDW